MQISENVSLKDLNTFGIDVSARYFLPLSDKEQLREHSGLISKNNLLILGGGSNILFTSDYDGLVLHNGIRGIELIKEDDDHIYVRTGAGENWHLFVLHCLQRGWAGIENLSLIPGSVGAGPIQNIGAYGVEMKEVFYELEAFHLAGQQVHTFSLGDCEFGYRDSVFKRRLKNQYLIVNVTFRLNKKPVFHTGYGAVEKELERMGITELTICAVSQAVINIRRSKLPDPAEIGNAGSFFKNPQVSASTYRSLNDKFPGIPGYRNEDGTCKLAAGWMIEQCGWKGFRRGDAGCHARQALVLVNYGKATGKEILDLSMEIAQSVQDRYGVQLEREVNAV
jgi:UDP-N-acetylmuramate dehydrogenase